jgi:hypothetical protein
MTDHPAPHGSLSAPTNNDRDIAIIEHVKRFRITTIEALRKLMFPSQGHAAVRKVTSRLCRHQRLNKYSLRHPRYYFTIGRRAALDLGVPLHRTQPVGPLSLPIEYAVLAYATLGPRYHRRLFATELRQELPWLARDRGESPICVDEAGQQRVFELFRVDLGGKPDHVARKCHADIQRRLRDRGFEQAVAQGHFRLVVVTGTQAKAQAIRKAIEQHLWPDALDLHFAIVNQLPLLMTGIQHGT